MPPSSGQKQCIYHHRIYLKKNTFKASSSFVNIFNSGEFRRFFFLPSLDAASHQYFICRSHIAGPPSTRYVKKLPVSLSSSLSYALSSSSSSSSKTPSSSPSSSSSSSNTSSSSSYPSSSKTPSSSPSSSLSSSSNSSSSSSSSSSKTPSLSPSSSSSSSNTSSSSSSSSYSLSKTSSDPVLEANHVGRYWLVNSIYSLSRTAELELLGDVKLSDRLVFAVMKLIHHARPGMFFGLDNLVMEQSGNTRSGRPNGDFVPDTFTNTFDPSRHSKRQYAQIVNTGNLHWVFVHGARLDQQIINLTLYDSLNTRSISDITRKQLKQVFGRQRFSLTKGRCFPQKLDNLCGVIACGLALGVSHGLIPNEMKFDLRNVRKQLHQVVEFANMKPIDIESCAKRADFIDMDKE